jgi:hypothetical protein
MAKRKAEEDPDQPDQTSAESSEENPGEESQASGGGVATTTQETPITEMSEEEFQERQRILVQQQGLPEGAVPEMRPQASQEVLPYHQSRTYNELKESGELDATTKPMPLSAYQTAAQAADGDGDGVLPRLFEGTRVRVTKGGPYFYKYGVIQRVTFPEFEGYAQAMSGIPDIANYAKPDSYTVKLRGARPEILELTPDELVEVSESEYVRSES